MNGGFFFRNPNTRGGVFSNDGGSTLLIGDLLDARDGVLDGSAGCPTVAVTNHVPDPIALGRVIDDPNCFSYQELFPGGFTPNFGGDNEDMGIVAGLRGATAGGIGWDLSVSTGENSVDHNISNTVNASFGPDSPTSFSLGTYTQSETNVNFDLTYAVSESVNVAGGVEWRDEEFEIGRGQPESYARPGGRLPAARRPALGVRRHERAGRVSRGELVRIERRRAVQRTDAMGLQRGLLVLETDLQLRRLLLAELAVVVGLAMIRFVVSLIR